MTSDRNRYDFICQEIKRANVLYYVLDAPSLTDAEYDDLFREVQALELKNPEWISKDSPTQTVGANTKSSGLKPVIHTRQMLSLDTKVKVTDAEDFDEKCKEVSGLAVVEYAAEVKFDGAALALKYKDGILVQGATRGDGTTGEDVTINALVITGIPKKIEGMTGEFEVRGEVMMTRSDYQAVNKSLLEAGKKTYSNARNAAAGILRTLDPKIVAERKLTFFGYVVLADNMEVFGETHSQTIDWLKQNGFSTSDDRKVVKGAEGLKSYYEHIGKIRYELDFEIDGVVYKINDLSLQDRMGYVSRCPRWAIAHKYPAERKPTPLRAIDVQVGRTGVLTPVGRLEPVAVGGVIVTSATLHNFEELAKKDVRVGDVVYVERSGDVIPAITGPDLSKRKSDAVAYVAPTTCPSCGSAIKAVPDEVAIRCSGGMACPAQSLKSLEHFVGRRMMELDGWGEKILEVLHNDPTFNVKTVADLFSVTKDELLKIPRLGEKNATKLIASREVSKTRPLGRLIFALGIPNVGETTGKDLAKTFGSMSSFLKASDEALLAIPGVGPSTVQSIRDFLSASKNIEVINKLMLCGISPPPEAMVSNHPEFDGKTFVITGTMLNMDRKKMEETVVLLGGKTSGSVSKKTSVLIAGPGAGGKLADAQKLGVTIWDENLFQEKLASPSTTYDESPATA